MVMGQSELRGPPPEFIELVRDALISQYDLPALHTHPLLQWVDASDGSTAARGRALRQALRQAINALYPGSGSTSAPEGAGAWRAWRTYRILELRYLEGLDVASVMQQVALSKAQYHREHARALETVASNLWEQWGVAARWSLSPPGLSLTPSNVTSLQQEAEQLVHRQGGWEHLDVGAVLQGVAQILRPLCANHRVRLDLSLSSAGVSVASERVSLRQALLSLLAPAIASTEDTALGVTLTSTERWATITLCGHARPSYSLTEAPGTRESRPFIEALHGRLCFAPAHYPDDAWTIQIHLPMHHQPRLLVIDNSPDFVALIDRMLRPHGWEVVGAAHANEAVRQLGHQPPDAILLDLVMPERDGWDVLIELKATPSTSAIPVFICSALAEAEVALSLGSAGYLRKPIDERSLFDALSAVR
jgi:CheY-like chemotaxis protein